MSYVVVFWLDLRGHAHCDVLGRGYSVNGLTPVSWSWVTVFFN